MCIFQQYMHKKKKKSTEENRNTCAVMPREACSYRPDSCGSHQDSRVPACGIFPCCLVFCFFLWKRYREVNPAFQQHAEVMLVSARKHLREEEHVNDGRITPGFFLKKGGLFQFCLSIESVKQCQFHESWIQLEHFSFILIN